MAIKNPTEETPDVSRSLNVWQKLLAVRNEFLEQGFKTSGKDISAGLTNDELVDISPQAEALFFKYGLFMQPYMTDTTANAQMVNTDNPDESILFSIPLKPVIKRGKSNRNKVLGKNAAAAHYRRYLYWAVLGLVETDSAPVYNTSDDKEAVHTSKQSATYISSSKRKHRRLTLCHSEPLANEEQVDSLKALLKRLLELDPENESFVQDIAVRTNSFADIKAITCDILIENVADMISAYPDQEVKL